MNFLRGIVILIGLLLVWEALVILFNLPPYILPSPLLVFSTFRHDYLIIAQQTVPTLIETILGLVLGTLLGSLAALSMAWLKPLKLWFLPVLLISQALPTFAIAPLLVIWLGYGMASKIATTIIMLFFPITSAFFDGLQRTEPGWLDLAKTMNASRLSILWRIRVPGALPSLASGLRVAAVFAPIGAVVGEWVGASKGLGFLMLNANARMQIDLMFAALFVLIAMTLILYFLVDGSLKRLIDW